MTSVDEKYDSAFLAILQNEGKIPSFLEQLFSFLYRRTDFFIIMKTQHEKMGFPPGVAIKLVVDAFKKFETRAKKDVERKERLQREKEAKSKVTEVVDMETVSPVLKEVEVTTQEHRNTESADTNSRVTQKDSDSKIAHSDSDSAQNEDINHPQNNELSSVQNKAQSVKEGLSKAHSVSEQSVVNKEEECKQGAEGGQESGTQEASGKADSKRKKEASEEDDDPELTKLQKEFQSHPESYNGAIRDNYSWAQSITDVDVHIKVPAYIKRGKDVTVSIGRKRLEASCRTEAGGRQTLCVGELCWEVRQEESVWSLVPGEHIHVSLEKVQERWWEAVLTDEPKISVRKIDPSRPMTDLDEEAQAKIGEMMHNEHQKRLGKPQSHEQKVHNMLEKAWDSEGSPFKGTPFDPSKVNVSGGGMGGFPPQ